MTAIVKEAETRITETPNATMTTLASPTLGGAGRSLWRVDMAAGAQGPVHVFDSEQLWTVVEGQVAIELDRESCDLDAGDTAVIPAGVERQVTATTPARMIVTGSADTTVAVPGEPMSRGTPPWIS